MKLLHVLLQILASQSVRVGLILAVDDQVHDLQPVSHVLGKTERKDLEERERVHNSLGHVLAAMIPCQE
eukprot:2624982-Rhodomonas_salina.3